MGQFSTEIYIPPGSTLSGYQQWCIGAKCAVIRHFPFTGIQQIERLQSQAGQLAHEIEAIPQPISTAAAAKPAYVWLPQVANPST
jgi:hypothetical protein